MSVLFNHKIGRFLLCSLACFLSLIPVYAQQSQSLYVGHSTYFSAPNPPSNAALNTSAWSCYGGDVTLEEQKIGTKVYGVKATVRSYFTGTAEIRCDYYYYWYDNYGRMHTNNATTYFYITCKPVNINLSTTSMELNVGQGRSLNYSLSPSISPAPTIRMYSSNTNVATVSSSGYVTAVGPGDCVITVENSAGPNATCSVHVRQINPTDVYLYSPEPIYIGQTVRLTPELYPSTAQTTYSWSSSDRSVASVSDGYVTGRSEGTASITVTTSNNLSASCDVEVYKPVPSRISLDKSSLRLPVGATESLTYQVTPSYAIYSVTWDNDAPDVVAVNNGRLEAKSPGTAIISVTTDNGKTASCKVTVPPEPTEISIVPDEMELLMGRTKELKYAFTPSDAATSSLTWESSEPKVASVNQQGLVKALRPGQTTLTVTTRNGVVGQCELTVPEPLFQLFVWNKEGIKMGYLSTDKPQFSVEGDIVHFSTEHLTMEIHRDTLDKFTLEQVLPEHPLEIGMPEEIKVGLGRSTQIKYTLVPADAATTVTWFNSNPEVVSVSESGMLSGIKQGTATLTAQTSNGLRATCQIVVPEPKWRFYVWLRSGEIAGFDIEEYPEVKLGTEVFTLTSSQSTVEYAAADVLRFTLNDTSVDDPETEIAIGIENTRDQSEQAPSFREGTLTVQGLAPGAMVGVYNLSGVMVLSSKANWDGKLSLSLDSLPSGVYIVKTGKTTYKYYKK